MFIWSSTSCAAVIAFFICRRQRRARIAADEASSTATGKSSLLQTGGGSEKAIETYNARSYADGAASGKTTHQPVESKVCAVGLCATLCKALLHSGICVEPVVMPARLSASSRQCGRVQCSSLPQTS